MNYTSMLDLLSLACGGYILITWLKLRMAGRLFANSLLVPRDKSPKDCIDPAGYILYISPRLLVVGIVIVLVSVAGLLNEFFHWYGLLVSELLIALCLAALVWFAVSSNKANKLYW